MDMRIVFPGGARVDAEFGPFTVKTDQPGPGGPGSAPTPFDTFLSSLGTCAGIYVLGFCRQRGIDASGITLLQTHETDPATGLVKTVKIEIRLPADFPPKYRQAVILAADQCKVKKTLEHPPAITVGTNQAAGTQ